MFQQLDPAVTSSEFTMPREAVFGNKCKPRKLMAVVCLPQKKKSGLFKAKQGRVGVGRQILYVPWRGEVKGPENAKRLWEVGSATAFRC